MLRTLRRWVPAAALLLLCLAVFPAVSSASHSWNVYHWARQSNPFTVKLIDRVTSTWDPILSTTSSDWTASSVLNTTIIAGTGSASSCSPVSGQVKVCNYTYGNTGWLGVAQIWLTTGSHIAQGTVKLNDTYHNNPPYNTTAWRNLVSCQEVGHTLGLDHQDENFNNPNLGTCMDYTNSPGTNQHPNTHDYNQLVTIYSHLDSFTSVKHLDEAAGPEPPAWRNIDLAGPGQWGKLIGQTDGGMTAVYEQDFGNGFKVVTFVIWADPDLLRGANPGLDADGGPQQQ
jgi:hypothetical protein